MSEPVAISERAQALVDVGVIMTLARRIEEAALKAGYK